MLMNLNDVKRVLEESLDRARQVIKDELKKEYRRLVEELDVSRQRTDLVYKERDRCVALIARMAVDLGHEAWLGKHDGANWEDDWRNIVFVRLPEGQISWHIHDSELPLFSFLKPRDEKWDGHTTEQKYERMNRYATR